MMARRRLSARSAAAAAIALLLTLGSIPAGAQRRDASQTWVGTWATAVVGRPVPGNAPAPPPQLPQPAAAAPAAGNADARPASARTPPPPIQFNNQTLRQIVHTSVAGQRVRLVLSNRFGTAPIAIGAAH